ncbi:MAG TPA: hypothetical protein VFG29_13005 [Syntrophales bacterium]|nr:hypothetical protein [Syntrophales bacterium]
MKRHFFLRNAFLSVIVTLLLLTVGVASVLAEDQKPVAATPVPGAAAPTPVTEAPAPAAPAEDKPTGSLSISGLSKYVWRGYENTKNSIVIQPSLTVGYSGFSANIWGNLDTKPYSTTNASYSSAWTETDLTLSYTKTFGILNAGVGYIYYGLGAPNAGAAKPLDSEEVFITLGLNTLLTPTLTAYKEIDHYHQYYFLLGISHTIEFNKIVSLQLGASASYLLSDYADATLYSVNPSYGGYPKFNDNYQATNDKFNNFHDGVLTASLPISVLKYLTVAPTVSYSFPLSNDAKNEIKARGKLTNPADNDSSFVYGGLTVTLSF